MSAAATPFALPDARLAAVLAEGAPYGMDEALRLAHAGPDAVRFDKLAPEDVAAVVRALAPMPRRPLVAATAG